jgi:hypothetical protein
VQRGSGLLSIHHNWCVVGTPNWNACFLVVHESNVVTAWADASVVSDFVLAITNSTVDAHAVICVAAELTAICLNTQVISMVAIASIGRSDPDFVNANTVATDVLLAVIYIAALHVGCRGTEIT